MDAFELDSSRYIPSMSTISIVCSISCWIYHFSLLLSLVVRNAESFLTEWNFIKNNNISEFCLLTEHIFLVIMESTKYSEKINWDAIAQNNFILELLSCIEFNILGNFCYFCIRKRRNALIHGSLHCRNSFIISNHTQNVHLVNNQQQH